MSVRAGGMLTNPISQPLLNYGKKPPAVLFQTVFLMRSSFRFVRSQRHVCTHARNGAYLLSRISHEDQPPDQEDKEPQAPTHNTIYIPVYLGHLEHLQAGLGSRPTRAHENRYHRKPQTAGAAMRTCRLSCALEPWRSR